jgi:rsbT co-antagonist protein RsbR
MATPSADAERLQAIFNAIALVSAGEFDLARAQIRPFDENILGMIEEALLIFFDELSEMTRKNAEAFAALASSKSELEQKIHTIEAQRVAIRELSVPIIDVWKGILTLPLVGLLDTSRAVEVTEKLLRRVADSDVQWVILDFTGVDVVDTSSANHMLKLTSAVQLLGARCVLTGIGGPVARTLVGLGVSLGDLTLLRSLQEGLKYCIARRAAVHPGGAPAQAAGSPGASR